MTDTAIAELAPEVGVRAACEVLRAAQAGYYRRHRQSPPPQRPDPIPHRDRHQPRALTETERQAILDQLRRPVCVDVSPRGARTPLDPGHLGRSDLLRHHCVQAGRESGKRQAPPAGHLRPELRDRAPNLCVIRASPSCGRQVDYYYLCDLVSGT